MSSPDTIELLNRMHVILHRSLPVYLGYARPWVDSRHAESMGILDRIVASRNALCDRICGMILELGGTIEYGFFPMSFTALHDVSFEYCLGLMIERQRKEIDILGKLADALRLAPVAQSLALEAVGEAKAHLDMLQELRPQPAGV